jgi:hypothetical protein
VIFGGVGVLGGVGTALTVMANAGSETTVVPSLTLITIFEKVPTFALDGVPLSKPVVVLNEVHEGAPVIEKTKVFWSASAADGWNA